MELEKAPCALCAGRDHRVLFEIHESDDPRQPKAWRGKAALPVVACRGCGLVFLNPRYDAERLRSLYQDPGLFTGTIDPEGRSRNIAAERAQRVARFKQDAEALARVKPTGRLLDVGCGLGFFLEALGPGYEAVGLDWSRPAVQALAGSSHKIVEARFPQHPFGKEAFDVVCLHNTLDHLPDPLAALKAARSLLKPDGVLMLTLVNFGSLCARVYGPDFRLLGPNHLYYFTPRTLDRLLAAAGLRRTRLEFPYFGTDVARPWTHAWRILRDACALRLLRRPGRRLSPPFYGNIMRVFATPAGAPGEDTAWLSAESLRRQEEEDRRQVENGAFDGRGHFGSFYAYSRGLNHEFIKSHAIIDEEAARAYAENLRLFLAFHDQAVRGDMLDMGCAIGTITDALRRLNPAGRAIGLDISAHAIEFAKKKHPACDFVCRPGDDLDCIADASLGLIHAREFYPFTRTNQADIHLNFLRPFARKLRAGGLAVLQMRHFPRSLRESLPGLKPALAELGFASSLESSMIPVRLSRKLGRCLESRGAYRAAAAASAAFLTLSGKPANLFFLLVKGAPK